MMNSLVRSGIVICLCSLLPACTQAQSDCTRNPELACFTAGSGTGGTTAAGGGGSTAAGGGGTGEDCGDAGNCGSCSDGIQDGNETGVDCGADTPCGKCAGEPCSTGSECTTGLCADGVCCDSSCDGPCEACDIPDKKGLCTPLAAGALDLACGGDGTCGEVPGYCRCNDGVKNGDETDVDCGGRTCGTPCGTGHSCSSPEDCLGGSCVDGYCCGAICQAECLACNLPALEGLCLPVEPGTTDQCAGQTICSGLGLCGKPAGELCGTTDWQCASNQCDSGVCVFCNNDSACDPGQSCANGGCFDKGAQGQPCPSTAACQDGFLCVDGVCCESACDGLCMGCHLDYTGQPSGTCAPILAGHDPHNECPQPDPSQPGPGGSAYCSGAPADMNGNSSCAQPQP